MINYNSVGDIKAILESCGLAMNKKFGQNFLLSEQARKDIIRHLQIPEQASVWEIGPGIGAMTPLAAAEAGKLTLFEIDKGFIKFLKSEYVEKEGSNISIIEGDVLKNWKAEAEKTGMPDRIFGNLPYNISSVIIAGFIENSFLPNRMVFTVQKELAQRMKASPGDSNYSSFSLLCQLDYEINAEKDISRGNFYPVPDVESTIVSMTLKKNQAEHNRADYFLLIRDLFSARRKTINNNLKNGSLKNKYPLDKIKQVFEKCEISLGARGETLSVAEYLKIADTLSEIK